jgi:hypothetical protein
MAQRRFHYEQAFEHYLRANRIPYVAVDEAKKALLPAEDAMSTIKSFDFVVYGPEGRNLLLDVKGRKLAARPRKVGGTGACGAGGRRLENWVTREDVEGLERWGRLFGPGFEPAFVFMYWCECQPPDALFEEIFEFAGRWYALRETTLADYRREMQRRSPRWDTLCVPTAAFNRISRPFSLRPPRRERSNWSQGPDVGRGGLLSGRLARHRVPGCSNLPAAVS